MFRFIIRFVFYILAVFVISMVILNTLGGPILSFALSKAFNIPIKIGSISYWGKDLVVKDIKVDKWVNVEDLEVSFIRKNSFLFPDKIYIRGITSRFFVEGGEGIVLPVPVLPNKSEDKGAKGDFIVPFRSFIAKDIELFICKKDEDSCIRLHDCDVSVYHPKDVMFFNVDMKAHIGEKGVISAKGWIDWDRKDADIDFESKDIDLTEFRGYFNMKALSGTLNLTSKAVAENDDLKIKNKLELSSLGMDGQGNALAAGILSALSGLSGNGHMGMEFALNTKLSKPDLSLENILSKIYKERRPDQYIKDTAIGTAESVLDLVGDVVGGFLDQIKKKD